MRKVLASQETEFYPTSEFAVLHIQILDESFQMVVSLKIEIQHMACKKVSEHDCNFSAPSV